MDIDSSSSSEELLVEQSYMDTNGCNIPVQFGTALSVHPVEVFACQTLRETIVLIHSNNTNQNNNQTQLTDYEERLFEKIEQLSDYPQEMFTNLIRQFTERYDTDLYIINFDRGKFDVMNKDDYLTENHKANMAFISFNEDNTICGPLCITIDNETIQTVFSCSDFGIWNNVDDYLEKLNKSKFESTVHSTQMEQHQNMIDVQELVGTSTTDYVAAGENQSNPMNPVQADDKTESHALLEQIIKPLFHLFDRLPLSSETISAVIQSFAFNIGDVEHLSVQEIITAVKNRVNCLSTLTEKVEQSISILQNDGTSVHQSVIPNDVNNQPIDASAEMDHALQAVFPSTDALIISLPTRLSNTIEVTNISIPLEPTPLEMEFNSPRIATRPKNEWHPRTIKELEDSKNPLLPGEGPQRTPIRVQVPIEGTTSVFLGIAVFTDDNQRHIYKVAVPEKTRVKAGFTLKNNDLNCLEFNECDSMYTFDPSTRYIYSKISSIEHEAQLKEVRLHIFNLYQDHIITKEKIKDKQLNLFKLAFWFCFCDNGVFKRVSPVSISEIIREKCVASRKMKNIADGKQANTLVK